MELYLKRIAKQKGYTIGKLYLKSAYDKTLHTGTYNNWICDTMEPQWRDLLHGAPKVKRETAIPEGRYSVVVTFSQKHQDYLPLLLGVPQFDYIRIHKGNFPCDTEGCILVGENKSKGMLFNSRKMLGELMEINNKRKEGEPLFIEIA